jgi:hypothetical protein
MDANLLTKYEASRLAKVTIACVEKWLIQYPHLKVKIIRKVYVKKDALLKLIEPKTVGGVK